MTLYYLITHSETGKGDTIGYFKTAKIKEVEEMVLEVIEQSEELVDKTYSIGKFSWEDFHEHDFKSYQTGPNLLLETCEKAGKLRIVEEPFMTCNMCGEGMMAHKQIGDTHIYTCTECPNTQFEYYSEKDILNLQKGLGAN